MFVIGEIEMNRWFKIWKTRGVGSLKETEKSKSLCQGGLSSNSSNIVVNWN